jgi:hypothetical protein
MEIVSLERVHPLLAAVVGAREFPGHGAHQSANLHGLVGVKSRCTWLEVMQ